MDVRVERVGAADWRYKIIGGIPPFRVYRDGELVALAFSREVVLSGSEDEPSLVEIVDAVQHESGPEISTVANSPRIRIQWEATDDAEIYLVQRQVGQSYETVRSYYDWGTRQYYEFVSPVLGDGETTIWRVVSLDKRRYRSIAVSANFFIVRPPDTPRVEFAYDHSAGTLMIGAAP